MSDARELLAFHAYIVEAMEPGDVARLGINSIAAAAAPGIARGWTGKELAAMALTGIYDGQLVNLSAAIHANVRKLAEQDPPREQTPVPPDIATMRAERVRAVTAASGVDHAGWAARIRKQHQQRRRQAYDEAGMAVPGPSGGQGDTETRNWTSHTTTPSTDPQNGDTR
jgi:hypothetical protein